MVTVTRTITPAGEALLTALRDLENRTLKVGWFESSKYDADTSVAEVAAQNEFGNSSKRIPPRPFMRPTIRERQGAWADLAASGARAILAGNESADSVLNALGGQASGDIASTITKVQSPALAPFTLMKRRESRGLPAGAPVSDKPLVDTGLMISSVTWVVE